MCSFSFLSLLLVLSLSSLANVACNEAKTDVAAVHTIPKVSLDNLGSPKTYKTSISDLNNRIEVKAANVPLTGSNANNTPSGNDTSSELAPNSQPVGLTEVATAKDGLTDDGIKPQFTQGTRRSNSCTTSNGRSRAGCGSRRSHTITGGLLTPKRRSPDIIYPTVGLGLGLGALILYTVAGASHWRNFKMPKPIQNLQNFFKSSDATQILAAKQTQAPPALRVSRCVQTANSSTAVSTEKANITSLENKPIEIVTALENIGNLKTEDIVKSQSCEKSKEYFYQIARQEKENDEQLLDATQWVLEGNILYPYEAGSGMTEMIISNADNSVTVTSIYLSYLARLRTPGGEITFKHKLYEFKKLEEERERFLKMKKKCESSFWTPQSAALIEAKGLQHSDVIAETRGELEFIKYTEAGKTKCMVIPQLMNSSLLSEAIHTFVEEAKIDPLNLPFQFLGCSQRGSGFFNALPHTHCSTFEKKKSELYGSPMVDYLLRHYFPKFPCLKPITPVYWPISDEAVEVTCEINLKQIAEKVSNELTDLSPEERQLARTPIPREHLAEILTLEELETLDPTAADQTVTIVRTIPNLFENSHMKTFRSKFIATHLPFLNNKNAERQDKVIAFDVEPIIDKSLKRLLFNPEP
eukprot:GHVT01026150.1.p1 GENE.GHVT01026150.1~~GHVT01026150.1.p1  ORF type:complete len:640 (+),score=39.07 GHVT01026150.1:207-2126(+)